MKISVNNYGSAIKLVRKHRGFSTRVLAKQIGMTHAQISRIENEKSALTLISAVRLFSILRISISDLLSKEITNSLPIFFQKKTQERKDSPQYLNYNDIDDLAISFLLDSRKTKEVITFYLEYLAKKAKFAIKESWNQRDFSRIAYNHLAFKDIYILESNNSPFKKESPLQLVDFRYPREMSLEGIRNIYQARGATVFLDIGAYIERTRIQKGWSLNTLGERINFSKEGIRKLEYQTPEKILLEDVIKLDYALGAQGELLDMAWKTARFYTGFYSSKRLVAERLVPYGSSEIPIMEKLVVLSRLFELYWPHPYEFWLEGFRKQSRQKFKEILENDQK